MLASAPLPANHGGLVILACVVPLGFLALVGVALLRDRTPEIPRILTQPPEDIHPVDLAYLWSAYRKHVSPKTAYRAELIHLARIGAIEMVPVGRVSDLEDLILRPLRRPRDELDTAMVDFLFPLGDDAVSLKELRARGTGIDRLGRWWVDVSQRGRTILDRILDGGSRFELFVAFFAGFLLVPALIGAVASDAFTSSNPLSGVVMLEGFACWIVVAVLLPAWLPDQLRRRVARWRAFRRYLRGFASVKDAPAAAVVIWERYLEDAIALGVAHTVERQVRALSPWRMLPSPWPGAPHGVAGFAWMRRLHRRGPRSAPAILIRPTILGR